MGLYQYQHKIENQQLLRLCCEGDSRAQRILYDRYVQAMYNRVIRMVTDRHLADDILQEVFIKVLFLMMGRLRLSRTVLGAWFSVLGPTGHRVPGTGYRYRLKIARIQNQGLANCKRRSKSVYILEIS